MSKLEPTRTYSNPTATDVLRRLLDERGVEWTVPGESWNQDSITYWKVGSIKWVAFESENDTLWLNCNSVTDLTPEQAIAATLGATDANPTQAESSGTCHMVLREDIRGYAYQDTYVCSECGEYVVRETYMGESEPPNYCPNCGRRCVG